MVYGAANTLRSSGDLARVDPRPREGPARPETADTLTTWRGNHLDSEQATEIYIYIYIYLFFVVLGFWGLSVKIGTRNVPNGPGLKHAT